MSSIIEVLTKNPKIPAERLDVDVFREEGALRESALLDVRSDALAGAMFFLFDCRGSLFINAGNTGALALFGVRFLCVKNFPERPRFWHTVATWSPSSLEQGKACLITFDMFSESSVSVYFSRGYFFVGDVPGADGPPPDYVEDTEGFIRKNMQSWSSPFEVHKTSFFIPH